MKKNEALIIELDEMKSLIEEEEWKYYHLRSIANFIYHLESLKGERRKELMRIDLARYIDEAKKKVNESSDVYSKSKQLFPLIWEISNVYRDEVGFIQKPSFWVTGIILISLFVLSNLFVDTRLALGICFVFLSGYSVRSYFKVRDRKTF